MNALKYTQKHGLALETVADPDDDNLIESLCKQERLRTCSWRLDKEGLSFTDVAFYKGEDGSGWYGMIELVIGDFVHLVFVESEEDYVSFVLNALPSSFMDRQNDLLSVIEGAVSRAFQAWHGHSCLTLCRVCDPIEYRLEKERLNRNKDAVDDQD